MRSLARLGAYVASATLVVGGGLVATAPAQASPPVEPVGVDSGATWLTGQLTNGVVHNTQYDYDDYGLTIDVAFALDAAGRSSVVQSIGSALSSKIDAYTQYQNSDKTIHTSGGGLAKLGVLADIVGDPHAYGGRNLVSDVSARIATAAPITGRLEDGGVGSGSFDGDNSNVLGQAYAARLLSAAGDTKAGDARSFLLQQQCPNGGFRQSFVADKTSSAQSCTDNSQAETDATAIVVTQLATLPSGTADAALAQARAWLISQQHSDGSWGGGSTTSSANANSTGLAATALGNTSQSALAAQWLRARQVTYYDVCDKLIRERGAIAYSDSSLTAGRREGITTTTQDQFRRAAAQAVPALAYLPAQAPSHPTLPQSSQYYVAGASPSLRIGGLKAGDQVCFNGPGILAQKVATGSTVEQHLTLPAGTATRAYAVRDAFGHIATTHFKVLGKKTLTVTRTPGRVHRSRVVTVALRGLAPHEAARIYYGSHLVRSAEASASGNLVARFSSGRSLGKKSIRGYGRFSAIRKGATSIRVVR